MKKNVLIGLIIAAIVIVVAIFGYFYFSASADAFTQNFCTGTSGAGFVNCPLNAQTWENYMETHNNAQFQKLLKKMVANDKSASSDNYSLGVTKSNVNGSGDGKITDASIPSKISCGTSCSGSYNSGSVVTLTATPADGSSFVSWGGACSGDSLTCTVTMNASKSVTAVFSNQVTYQLKINTMGLHSGKITIVPDSITGISCNGDTGCNATYVKTTSVTLTATGTNFTGWTGDCTGTSATCTISMNSDKKVTADFE